MNFTLQRLFLSTASFAVVAVLHCPNTLGEEYLNGIKWQRPEVVQPGENCGDPPADAIVLFGGKDLSSWKTVTNGRSRMAPWSAAREW